MNKIDSFVVDSVVDNINNFNANQIVRLANLLANSKNGAKLSNHLVFAIQENELYNIEVQDPV